MKPAPFFVRISTKYVAKGPINWTASIGSDNGLAHNVQITAWRITASKSLSEPMIAKFTDAYMRHSASLIQRDNVDNVFLTDFDGDIYLKLGSGCEGPLIWLHHDDVIKWKHFPRY